MIVITPEFLKTIPYNSLSESMQFHPQLNILFYGSPDVRLKEIPLNWADSDAPSSIHVITYGGALLKILLKYWYSVTVLRKTSNSALSIAQKPDEVFPYFVSGKGAT